jgi:hypothetical protein
MPGLKTLRDRYVKRARFLAEDKVFALEMAAAREQWNVAFPKCPIVYSSGPRDPEPTGWWPQYQPTGMTDHAALNWHSFAWSGPLFNFEPDVPEAVRSKVLEEEGIRVRESLVPRYFPRDDFPIPPNPVSPHPAAIFISASLLFESRFFAVEAIKRMFPPHDYKLTVRFEVNTSDAIAAGARLNALYDFLAARLRDLLPAEEVNRIIRECQRADRDAYDRVFRDYAGKVGTRAGRPAIPSIQLFPGISGQDLKDAIPWIIAAMSAHYRKSDLVHRIREIRADGASYQEIANRLGVTRDTVRRALIDFQPDSDG